MRKPLHSLAPSVYIRTVPGLSLATSLSQISLLISLSACILPEYTGASENAGGASGGAGASGGSGTGGGTGGAGGGAGGAGGTGGAEAGGGAGGGCPDTTFIGHFGDDGAELQLSALPDGAFSFVTGNTVVAGTFNQSFTFDGVSLPAAPQGAASLLVAAFDRNGAPAWHLRVDGSSNLRLNRVIGLSDGALVLFHDVPTSPLQELTIEGLSPFVMEGNEDGFALKLAHDGSPQWAKQLTGSGSGVFTGGVETPGGLVLVGSLRGDVTLEGLPRHTGANYAPFTARLNAAGALTHYQDWELTGSDGLFNDVLLDDTKLYITGAYKGTLPVVPIAPDATSNYISVVLRFDAPLQPTGDLVGPQTTPIFHPTREAFGMRLIKAAAGVLVAGRVHGGSDTTPLLFGLPNQMTAPLTTGASSYLSLLDVSDGAWKPLWGNTVNTVNSETHYHLSSFALLPEAQGSGILLGHAVDAESSTVVDATTFTAPSVFLGLNSTQPNAGVPANAAQIASAGEGRPYMRLIPTECGSLLIGKYNGTPNIAAQVQEAPEVGYRNIVGFLPQGISFSPL